VKNIMIVLFVLFAMVPGGCKKNTTTASGGPYRGVVLFNICTHTEIQTLGPNYLGEDTWASGTTVGSPVYHHVLAVQNGCQFGDHKQGDTISFIVVAPQVQNCFHCMIAVVVPDSVYPIQVLN
jgi:hypothetical protein